MLGAEVVLGDGRVLNLKNNLRKNNTGYGMSGKDRKERRGKGG